MRLLPVAFALLLLSSCSYYFGKPKLAKGFAGNPPELGHVYAEAHAQQGDYDASNPLILDYANQPFPDKDSIGRDDVLRKMIARLLLHRDVDTVNKYLLSIKPWARPGTDWALHKHGDYDFSMVPMCMLLYLFDDQPDLLYPATKEHIVKVLLIHESHKKATRSPGTLGMMRETENHILMGEITRYLQNQWLHEHGDTTLLHDNIRNGMDAWMVNHMKEKLQGGMYEFNSNPYSGYSIAALLTLYSFAHSDSVQTSCGQLLDQLVLEYALGSVNQRRFPAFRRRLERAGLRTFAEDPLTNYVRTWLKIKYPDQDFGTTPRKNFAFTGMVLKYRLNDQLATLLTNRNMLYFAQLGHGYHGSPEIYSGGRGFTISAGGLQRGMASQLIAHPTVLLIKDQVSSIDSCIYLPGKGSMKHWNNTGVYRDFACGPLPVHIPPQYTPIFTVGNWYLYPNPHGIGYIITYSKPNLGLLFVATDMSQTPKEILEFMDSHNTAKALNHKAVMPNNDTIAYNVRAPKGKWVICKVNGKAVNRKYDKWPRLTVDLK